MIRHVIEMMYVDIKDTVALELMALKATVEPILMSERRQVISHVSRTALRGIFQPGLTCPMKPAKGKPPSRAKDQDCRETVANVLMTEDVMVTTMIAVMIDAPAYDPVPL